MKKQIVSERISVTTNDIQDKILIHFIQFFKFYQIFFLFSYQRLAAATAIAVASVASVASVAAVAVFKRNRDSSFAIVNRR